MYDGRPEEDIEELLDMHRDAMSKFRYQNKSTLEWEEWGTNYVTTPVYILNDAVERLKRYEVIVNNLLASANLLWVENLRSRGMRRIKKSDTPMSLYKDETYQRMCVFVNRLEGEITLDDVFVELVLAMSRIYSNDPTGFSQYLDKEEKLFDQLEGGQSDG